MAFAIYLHREQFQPEEPLILDKNITADAKFTFVDFVPAVIKRSGTVIPTGEVEYHSFGVMIETANEWLRKNLQWEVVNCETVILLYKYNDVGNFYELRPNDCCFYIYGTEKNNVLKALRLWLQPRDINSANQRSECQVLRYIDLIPESKETTDFVGSKFEGLDDVINRVNATIKSGGISGRIITIETLQCDATTDWKIDTDITLSTFSSKNVFILRIFYVNGSPCEEEIGIEDFAPQQISGGGFFKRPKFEPFNEVIERASRWLSENPHLKFRNAQSIDIKMKSLSSVNTRCLSYTEHGDYIRIFRLTYTKSRNKDDDDTQPSPVYFSTKLFIPLKKSETINDIIQKLNEWVNQALEIATAQSTDLGEDTRRYPRLLSAETVEVYAREFRDDNIVELEKACNDDTFQFNRFGNKNAYMFFAFRIFYDFGTNGRTQNAAASVSGDDNGSDNNGVKNSPISSNSNVNTSNNACVVM